MSEIPHTRRLVIFFAILLAILLFALDNMIVTPAMARIVSELGGSLYLNWVFTAYLLTSTITTPIYGKLSDIFSRRIMFIVAIVIFTVASVLCGFSQSIFQLIFFRGLQGIGGGAILVTAMSMIGEIFSLKERARYQGYLGATFSVAAVTGPLLGAFITEAFSWRYAFFINIPFGIIALLLIVLYVPKRLHQYKDHRIDYMGATWLTLFLTPLVLLFSLIAEAKRITESSVTLLAFSCIAFLVFYYVETKAKSPIFSHHLFSDRYFVVPAIMSFTNGIIMFAATIYIQIYAQKVLNLSIKDSGMLLPAITVPLTLSSIVYGQIVSKTGKYKNIVISGAVILLVSLLALARLLTSIPSVFDFRLHLIPLGLGLGAMMSIFNMIIQMIYPRERLGEVMGALQLVRGIGGTFGTAFLGCIFGYFVSDLNTSPDAVELALLYIFIILSFLGAVSVVASLYMKEKHTTSQG